MTRQLPILGTEGRELAQLDVRRAALGELVDAAIRRSDEPMGANTARAYRAAWARWADWCDARGIVDYAPVEAHELLGMLEGMNRAGLAPATIDLTLSAISSVDAWMRTQAGQTPVAVRQDGRVRRWLRSVRKERAEDKQRQAPPLLRPDLMHVLGELERIEPQRGIGLEALRWLARRDHAMILIGWLGAFRTEVIARLRVSDVRVDAEGLEVIVRKSKTRQTGDAQTKYLYAQRVPELCPRTQWLLWLELRGACEDEAPAFPSRTNKRMRPIDVSNTVARRCVAAGVTRCTGHSLRAGLATWAKLAGQSESDIQAHGDWRGESVQRYFRRASARDGNPTKGLF